MTDEVNGKEFKALPPHKVAGHPYVQVPEEQRGEYLILSVSPLLDEAVDSILDVINNIIEKYQSLDEEAFGTMFIPALKVVEIILMNNHVRQSIDAGRVGGTQDLINLLNQMGERDGGSPSN